MKNLNLKTLPKKIVSFLKKLRRYAVFASVMFVLIAYGFVVYRIRTHVAHEPDNEVVNERLNNLRRPKIDQPTIDKIQQLQESNIQVKTLFDQARDNPFQD